MKRISNKTIAVVSLIGSLVGSIACAEARCHHPPIHWTFGKTVSTLWSTDEESVCTSRSLYPDSIEKIQIVSKPKHGTAGAAGSDSVAYKPNWGYRGSDAFTYIVISSSNAKKGAGRVARVNVFVDVR
jgi:Bacterial Ig domain